MNTLAARPPSTRLLDKKVKAARALLRELQETLEDFEDRLDLAKAIAENAGKPLIPWEAAAKELGIHPPKKRRSRKTLRQL